MFPAVVPSVAAAAGPPPGPAWEDPSWLAVCIQRQTMVLLSRNNRNPASVNTQINILIHTAGAGAGDTEQPRQPLATLQSGQRDEISNCTVII